MNRDKFLPITKEDAQKRGWEEIDFLLVTGDAYVDHPSFGAAIIGRVLEYSGYKVGIVSQPEWTTPKDFFEFGIPKYAVLISGGNVDSMVAHYTVAKKRRNFDEYTPGGKPNKRPDRVIDVYSKLAKQAFPDIPVVVGGLEASLRRFAHYDYWEDCVLPSIAQTSGADIISYGMGERSILQIANGLAQGKTLQELYEIDGIAYLTHFENLPAKYVECAGYNKVKQDKLAYAKACRIQLDNQDAASALPIVQKQSEMYLVQNKPARALYRAELDKIYALPYTRQCHPSYNKLGGVPGLEEVEFSIIQNRGCFGGCNFCAIALHQGLRVTSRSVDSVVKEGELITQQPGFKGYIHDVGGPTANFRLPSCAKQITKGVCTGGKHCLAPQPCQKLIIDHSEYLEILRKLRALPKVKKVFIRSGIRYDYLMYDKDGTFFKELVEHHVSGQLKVAPEHCSPGVLSAMGKPSIETYNRFSKRFYEITKELNKPQYLIPYLISSHPGSTLKDAINLAEYLYDNHIKPEQVQDFYPTPGTVSTCMYYTELDPFTLKSIYVARDPKDKSMQRALLQYYNPKNAPQIRKALQKSHREDLADKLLPPSARVGLNVKKETVKTNRKKGKQKVKATQKKKTSSKR